jgi:catechol 2,3-dioxygenase-like lactoylglutathione lyase family enzyme
MAYHHIAIATRDLAASHRFYTESCGFELQKVVASPTPDAQGWARHLFYATDGGEMFAIWDLHTPAIPSEFPTAISTGLGLPEWVNHIAFAADDLDDLRRRRDRWVANGNDVAEINHGWCTSIYANDPNGIMVEFCVTTQAFTDQDRADAAALLAAEMPELDHTIPDIQFFTATVSA